MNTLSAEQNEAKAQAFGFILGLGRKNKQPTLTSKAAQCSHDAKKKFELAQEKRELDAMIDEEKE